MGAFTECSEILYVSYPHIIYVKFKSAITSGTFWWNALVNGILLEFSGIRSHNSLGAGKGIKGHSGGYSLLLIYLIHPLILIFA